MKKVKNSFVLLCITCGACPISAHGDEVNDLKIRGYLQLAYDKGTSIESHEPPNCSFGVSVIAKAQNRAKVGTKEGINDALTLATNYIQSSPTTWESDFLRLSLALNYAASGDSRSAAEAAEQALAKIDFKRLQNNPDVALQWLREKFGKEKFGTIGNSVGKRV